MLVGLFVFVVNSEQLYIRGGANEKKYRNFSIKRRSRIGAPLDHAPQTKAKLPNE